MLGSSAISVLPTYRHVYVQPARIELSMDSEGDQLWLELGIP